jgi:hypothetical protein
MQPDGAQVKFDLPTLLSVLGVVLTIAFFGIGYRQTIGARRERARAANKSVTDVLFRRLTLEDEFTLSAPGIDKLLRGWALEARVRDSDMLNTEDLEATLVARVLENDYITAEQRRSIMQRIRGLFKNDATLLYPSDTQENTSERPEALWLAAGSGLAAVAILIAVVGVTASWNPSALADTINKSEIIPSILAIAATVGLIFLFSIIKERAKEPHPDHSRIDQANSFERTFLRVARRYLTTLAPAERRDLDFTFLHKGERYGVELRLDASRLGRVRLQGLLNTLEKAAREMELKAVYLISPKFPAPERLPKASGTVRMISPAEFMEMIRAESEPSADQPPSAD